MSSNKDNDFQGLVNRIKGKNFPVVQHEVGMFLHSLIAKSLQNDAQKTEIFSNISIVSCAPNSCIKKYGSMVYQLYLGFCREMKAQHDTWEVETEEKFNFSNYNNQFVIAVYNLQTDGKEPLCVPVAYIQYRRTKKTGMCYVHQLYVADKHVFDNTPQLSCMQYVKENGFSRMHLGKLLLATAHVEAFLSGCRFFFLFVSPKAVHAIKLYDLLGYGDVNGMQDGSAKQELLQKIADFERLRHDSEEYTVEQLLDDVVVTDEDKIYCKVYTKLGQSSSIMSDVVERLNLQQIKQEQEVDVKKEPDEEAHQTMQADGSKAGIAVKDENGHAFHTRNGSKAGIAVKDEELYQDGPAFHTRNAVMRKRASNVAGRTRSQTGGMPGSSFVVIKDEHSEKSSGARGSGSRHAAVVIKDEHSEKSSGARGSGSRHAAVVIKDEHGAESSRPKRGARDGVTDEHASSIAGRTRSRTKGMPGSSVVAVKDADTKKFKLGKAFPSCICLRCSKTIAPSGAADTVSPMDLDRLSSWFMACITQDPHCL